MNGSGRRRMVLTKLKMAVFAPMPSASVSTATAVKPGFFSNWRKANFKSFITQRLHRIDFGCAAPGQPAREQSDAKQNERGRHERERVVRFHIVEQARDELRDLCPTGRPEQPAHLRQHD